MNQNETAKIPKSIVFFDGLCNLCNSSVDWLIKRDKKKLLLFTSIQGETAKLHLSPDETKQLSSIVVKTPEGQLLRESKAAFYLLSQVESGMKWLLIFMILPSFLADFGYRLIAKNRFVIFGKRSTCRLPSAEEKSYFLP